MSKKLRCIVCAKEHNSKLAFSLSRCPNGMPHQPMLVRPHSASTHTADADVEEQHLLRHQNSFKTSGKEPSVSGKPPQASHQAPTQVGEEFASTRRAAVMVPEGGYIPSKESQVPSTTTTTTGGASAIQINSAQVERIGAKPQKNSPCRASTPSAPPLSPCGYTRSELHELNKDLFGMPVWETYFFKTDDPSKVPKKFKGDPRQLHNEELRCYRCGCTIDQHRFKGASSQRTSSSFDPELRRSVGWDQGSGSTRYHFFLPSEYSEKLRPAIQDCLEDLGVLCSDQPYSLETRWKCYNKVLGVDVKLYVNPGACTPGLLLEALRPLCPEVDLLTEERSQAIDIQQVKHVPKERDMGGDSGAVGLNYKQRYEEGQEKKVVG